MKNAVTEYINAHWDECIKTNTEDNGTLIGVPYPYTVPAVGQFNELYYWDTYFTNKGLELSGRWQQAKNNTDDMLFLVKRFGFMPNGNRTWYLNNSQPPFLSLMVRDVFDHCKDTEWLSEAYDALKIEYAFWMEKRITKIGLNQYNPVVFDDETDKLAADFKNRVGYVPFDDKTKLAHNFRITAESGWDANPRWGFDAQSFVQVDLNSLLYMLEKNMEYFAQILENGEEKLWKERAEHRQTLMKRYMSDDQGLLFDYNFETGERGKVFSVASYYPMFAGLLSDCEAKALADALTRLEYDYGIAACEKNDVPGRYQWNFPNGWPCLQYIMIEAMRKYGFKEEAQRIAQKYTQTIEAIFAETQNLWEKYNVEKGNIEVTDEYEMPVMMGWSAGTYLAAKAFLDNRQ